MSTTAQQTVSLLDEVRGMEPIDGYSTRSYFELVEAQAEKLLELLGVSEPPVNVEVLERVPDVVVKRRAKDLPMVHDHIALRNGTFHISIDESQDAASQRFKLAHSLHHVLTYTAKSNIDWKCRHEAGQDTYDFDEALADRFSLALLMPGAWVRNAYNDGTTELHALAKRFDVSLNRMAYRLAMMGLPIQERSEDTVA